MFRKCIEIIVLFGCLELSEQLETCPIEVNTANYFSVNAAECSDLSELRALCNGSAYCYKDLGFGGDRCNKTNDGVKVNIPLERQNCDKLEIKCGDNILLNCEVLKYKRPDNVHCTYDVNNENVFITCEAVRIFPGGKCQFQLYSNKKENSPINATLKINGNLSDASCNFSYPISHYDKSNNVINIYVYPNVTGIHHGINASLKISLDISVSISHCPREYTNVNETINCTCVRSDDSQITAQPMWYNGSHDVQFNGSPTLSITAFNISQDYYCMARKYKISSNNVTYSATLKDSDVISGENILRTERERRDETENQLDIYWIIAAVTVVVLMCFVIVLLVAKHNKFTYRKYRKLRAYQSKSKKRKNYEVHTDNDDIFNLNSAKCIEI